MLAMREEMALAIQRSNLPILVQSNSVGPLSSLSNSSLAKSSYGHLLQEIKLLMLEREFVLVKIARSQINVFHRLANYGHTARNTTCWLQRGSHFPLDLVALNRNTIALK